MIDPRAIIDPSAEIAEEVAIGPFTIIGADVKIGAGCQIGPHVVIESGSELGRENRIYQFASIGGAPQDVTYAGEPTRLVIGDRNIIRESATLHRGTARGGALTRVGDGNWFMAYSHVAHDCVVGNNTIFANCASLAGHVHVGNYAIIGGLVGVHQFCRIGDHAFISMGAMVSQDVPPYVMASGNYARAIGINKVGLRRRGFDDEAIRAIRRTFKKIVKSRLPRSLVYPQVNELAEHFPEVAHFLKFIKESKRGIVR